MMIQEQDALQLALNARSYVGILTEILARSTSKGRYGFKEDYAVHKFDKPFDEQNPNNWISTPQVPLYIEVIFKEVSALKIEDKLRSSVTTLLQSTVEDLERISQSRNPESSCVTSVSDIIYYTGSVLPEIKKYLEGIKSPEMV